MKIVFKARRKLSREKAKIRVALRRGIQQVDLPETKIEEDVSPLVEEIKPKKSRD